ncbi:MAG: SbcC/MukB-like Walker B domain-containing protein [Aureliella sp.]
MDKLAHQTNDDLQTGAEAAHTWHDHVRPGYRLKKLEVTNWGTFDSTDGRVFSLAPDGRTALLVGQNGSGKSTLVDALLTLLVQPGVRNYNVAAGAKKRERDERTYLRGACGRSSDEELGSVTDYLRPHDNHYSVLLACFERAATGEAFTVAQVLQITGDGELDKTYAFCPSERSIAADLSGLQRGQRIAKQLIQRGFQATSKYTEYLPWIARRTHFRPKAMDVFNQTVAVKDIQSLNRFIRDHMLEPHPWRERIEGLLGHFTQLSQAHQSLVKARRQVELLTPVAMAAEAHRSLAADMESCQHQLDAVDSYFRTHLVAWLTPRLRKHASAISAAGRIKQELQTEIETLDETQRYLKNELEKTGGQRLRQLPLLLETQQALLTAKRRERQRLQTALQTAGITADATDSCSSQTSLLETRQGFEAIPQQLENRRLQLAEQSSHLAEQRLQQARSLTDLRSCIDEEQSQLDALSAQPGNIPNWLAEVRSAMAAELKLNESQLVFACELISVAEAELEWQPAIETVLRRFALSLLVPELHYREVSHYVETRSLVDARGRGQRLVYIRVPDSTEPRSPDRLHHDSLLRKLVLRTPENAMTSMDADDQPSLRAWLEHELRRRYDYRCCQTLEQFQRAPGLAITRNRHIKLGRQQHEKDDRPGGVDSRRFVLGWDNAQRLSDLRGSLSHLRQQQQSMLTTIGELESESRVLSKKLAAIDTASGVPDFDLIDTHRHQREIDALEAERRAIEDSNDTVRLLRERLDAAIERRFAAQHDRDTQVATESTLLRENDQASHWLARHQELLSERESQGTLASHRLTFDTLDAALYEKLSELQELSEFTELQSETSHAIQVRLNTLHSAAEPIRADGIRAMQKFLSDSPEERSDLRADWLYLDGFLGLLDQLRQEDLPRHEARFRERLNDNVTQELGVFHAALHCEHQEILSKIELLNGSLEQLEYRAGTYMRLEPRDVSDREIREFQSLLRDCLSDAFDDNATANEARYNRIERFIRRLREEERWREKVTDVRRWFDFTARELDGISGVERSCYEDSSGQSGGEKAKLAFTILVAAIAYQFDIDPNQPDDDRLHFVVVDEMFSKVDDRYAEYALQLFEKFGLQLLIVAPLDAKARVTEPYVGCYLHTVKHEHTRISDVICLTADEYEQAQQVHSLQKQSTRKTTQTAGQKIPRAPTKPR